MHQVFTSSTQRQEAAASADAFIQKVKPLGIAALPFLLAMLVVPTHTLSPSDCPPAGEGLLACQVFKGWVPYLTSVALVGLGVYGAGVATFISGPRTYRRWKSGERLRFGRPSPAQRVIAHTDAALAAATWSQAQTTTDGTKVLSGFTWAQAQHRAQRLAAAAPQLAIESVQPTITRSFQPVALQGGVGLHVCGQCLTVVEGDITSATVACPSCGAEAVRQHRVRPRTSRQVTQPSSPATRVVLLSGGLDQRSLGRLEMAVTRRAEEPRRIVVLQIATGETVTANALRTITRASASAHGAGGHIVLASPDASVRDALREVAGVSIAESTSQAMELASSFAPSELASAVAPARVNL